MFYILYICTKVLNSGMYFNTEAHPHLYAKFPSEIFNLDLDFIKFIAENRFTSTSC